MRDPGRELRKVEMCCEGSYTASAMLWDTHATLRRGGQDGSEVTPRVCSTGLAFARDGHSLYQRDGQGPGIWVPALAQGGFETLSALTTEAFALP